MLVTKFRHLFLVRPIITIFVDPTNRERSGEDEREQQSLYIPQQPSPAGRRLLLPSNGFDTTVLRTDTGVGHYRQLLAGVLTFQRKWHLLKGRTERAVSYAFTAC